MALSDLLSLYRKQDWEDASIETYRNAYQRFGGSFITHPDVLIKISQILDLELKILAKYENGDIIGALPIWGSYIAGSKDAMRGMGRRDWIDVGNPEIILPLSSNHRFKIRYKAKYLSEKNSHQIINARLLPYKIGIAKSLRGGEFTGRFRYNQRRTKRSLEEAGAKIISLSHIPSEQIAEAYIRLSSMRWGCKPEGHLRLVTLLDALRSNLAGHIICVADRPIAIQLAFFAESLQWLSYEGVNGAVDPSTKNLSPGTVLTYIGLETAEEHAYNNGKQLRYSFGKIDDDYKLLWCKSSSVFRT